MCHPAPANASARRTSSAWRAQRRLSAGARTSHAVAATTTCSSPTPSAQRLFGPWLKRLSQTRRSRGLSSRCAAWERAAKGHAIRPRLLALHGCHPLPGQPVLHVAARGGADETPPLRARWRRGQPSRGRRARARARPAPSSSGLVGSRAKLATALCRAAVAATLPHSRRPTWLRRRRPEANATTAEAAAAAAAAQIECAASRLRGSRLHTARGMLGHEFCLVPRGDTPTSGRLYAALACRCVPLIISNRFAEHYAFAARGAYAEWVISVPEGEFLREPRAAVERAIASARPRLPQMRAAMEGASRELLYDDGSAGGAGGTSRAADNLLQGWGAQCRVVH